MESTPAPTTRSSGVRYGAIMGVVSSLYFLVLSLTGLNSTQGIWSWLQYALIAAVLFLAHKYFKDNGDGFMSFGQGVGIGFWFSLVSSAISTTFFYVYVKFVDSSFIQTIKDKQVEAMQARGMSDEQIDQAMEMAGKFMSPEVMFVFGIVGGIIGGIIIALIVSLITQKKNPEMPV